MVPPSKRHYRSMVQRQDGCPCRENVHEFTAGVREAAKMNVENY